MLRLRAIDVILVEVAPTGNTAVTTDDCIYFAYTLCQCLPKLLNRFIRAAAFVMIGPYFGTVRAFVVEGKGATHL